MVLKSIVKSIKIQIRPYW